MREGLTTADHETAGAVFVVGQQCSCLAARHMFEFGQCVGAFDSATTCGPTEAADAMLPKTGPKVVRNFGLRRSRSSVFTGLRCILVSCIWSFFILATFRMIRLALATH